MTRLSRADEGQVGGTRYGNPSREGQDTRPGPEPNATDDGSGHAG